MQIASGGLQTAKCILQSGTVNYKLQFASCKLLFAYYKLQTAIYVFKSVLHMGQLKYFIRLSQNFSDSDRICQNLTEVAGAIKGIQMRAYVSAFLTIGQGGQESIRPTTGSDCRP